MLSLDVVIPVYNEENKLEACIDRLWRHLHEHSSFDWRILIADNASTDRTLAIAKELAVSYDRVAWLHLDEKGRGRALRTAWTRSPADLMAYMDVDLATDLAALGPLLAPLAADEADLAIGSRLMKGSRVRRGLKREIVSRAYNFVVGLFFPSRRFRDAQTGFKAITREVARKLVPLTEDTHWFFDTELLLLAERHGYRITEIPVTWSDQPDSRVNVARDATAKIRALMRLRQRFRQAG